MKPSVPSFLPSSFRLAALQPQPWIMQFFPEPSRPNEIPAFLLANPVPSRFLRLNQPFHFTIEPYAFIARDDTLTYSATLGDGRPLPSWLSFDASSRTLSGIPLLCGQLNVRVTATNSQGKSVSDTIQLSIGKAELALSHGYAHGIAMEGNRAYLATAWDGLAILDISQPYQPTPLGRLDTPGYAYDVAVSGSIAYLAASNSGLLVVDVSEPIKPTLIGSLKTPSGARSLAVSGNRAFVVDGGGLWIVDVSDPSKPSMIGHFDTTGYAMNVAVAGDYAYVANFWGGLSIVDIREPAKPRLVGSHQTSGEAYGVAIEGSLALLTCRLGLEIVDLANPAAPILLSMYPFPVEEDGYWVKGASIKGHKAYVSTQRSGVHVLDISDPTSPELLEVYSMSDANDLVVAGSSVLVADETRIRVLDTVNTDATPEIAEPLVRGAFKGVTAVQWQPFSHVLSEEIFIDPGDVLTYTATLGDGSPLPDWLAFDPTTRTLSGLPLQTGSLNIQIIAADQLGQQATETFLLTVLSGYSITPSPTDIVVQRDKVFFLSGGNLAFVDTSYLLSSELGPAIVSLEGGSGFLALAGDYAYVAKPSIGLQIVDISQAGEPYLRGTFADSGGVTATVAYKTYALLGGGGMVKIIDPSNPEQPALVHAFQVNGDPSAIAIKGELAIIASRGWEGVQIYDLSDVSQPMLIGSLAFADMGLASELVVEGETLYLSTTQGLLIADLSDPSQPFILGRFSLPSTWQRSLLVVDRLAYLTSSDAGIQVVDVLDPLNPQLVAVYNTPGQANSIASSSSHVFVADINGLASFPLLPQPALNQGQAQFGIHGALSVGYTLKAVLHTVDPDGNVPESSYTYSWQTSSDGTRWLAVGHLDSYVISPADGGKFLRLQVSYVDAQGFSEVTTSQVGDQPIPIPTTLVALSPPPFPSRAEGNIGSTAFNFTVVRRGDLVGFTSVNWRLDGVGEAPVNGEDFSAGVLPSGTVEFAPGETSQSITIDVASDTSVEANEAFAITLQAPSGANLDSAASSASGIIQNDDTSIALNRSSVVQQEGNHGTTTFAFNLIRNGDTSAVSSVRWSLAETGAHPATADDFSGGVIPSGTVSFGIGETQRTITVEIAADRVVEPRETFQLILSNPNGASLDPTAQTGLAVIANDDTEIPYRLADIRPGASGSDPRELSAVGNLCYFSASDGTSGHELWKSDGTAAGTVRVADIHPGGNSSNPRSFTAVGNTLYFSASDGTSGDELWKSDGTAAGTVRVADIRPGSSGSSPRYLTTVGDTLYFRASDGTSGYELWKSDGTAAGTVRVADIRAGIFGSYPRYLTAVGHTLYFRANDGSSGEELWKSDGTAAGTVHVADIRPGIAGSNPADFITVGNTLYFRASDGSSGEELWKSDGTTAGTVRVADIRTGWNSSYPRYLTAVGDTVYFSANDGFRGNRLWKSDGTASGTVQVADSLTGSSASYPRELTPLGNTIFFATNTAVWSATDNLAGTATDIKPLTSVVELSNPSQLTAVGETLFFVAEDSSAGREVWRSDGTSESTFRLSDSRQGAAGSDPLNLVAIGPRLYFTADDGLGGRELWLQDDAVTVLPTFAVVGSSVDKAEGNAGSTAFTFTVQRNGQASGSSTVEWSVTSNTAAANDFVGGVFPSGSLDFAPFQVSQTITIQVAADA
ncbi:MAG: ELWxxDGT repeat protein, partial [Cyanobacteriota bacterium]|nr:ELWxxDGT repeat protein [Cyanobacteriota bacterium]